MDKKYLRGVFYCIVFLALAFTIYRLACFIPPMPGEDNFLLYRIGAAGTALLTAGAAVGGILAIDYLGNNDRE